MQQHLGRLDGVAKVEVSLATGKVVIYPKSDSVLDPTVITKATYDSGVSVAEMDMTASGRLVRDAGKGWVFEIAPNQSFIVMPNELSRGLEQTEPSAQITLRGRLYKKPAAKTKVKPAGPFPFEVLEVVKPPLSGKD